MKTELLKLTPSQFCRTCGSCAEGARFALRQPSMAAAWDNSPNVDWLLWILNAIDAPVDAKVARQCIVECIRATPTAVALLTDRRSLAVLKVVDRHVKGRASKAELKQARDRAVDAHLVCRDPAARAAAGCAARSASPVMTWTEVWHGTRCADNNVETFRKSFANPFKAA